MSDYQFTLKFALPNAQADPEDYLDALFEAGCDDALVGVGQYGSIGLDFARSGPDAMAAVRSAIRDVRAAIPHACLIEVTPDLVGLAEIADLFGCSRQNVRKVVLGPKTAFPPPVHTGGHAALWHLVDVLGWAAERDQRLTVAEPRALHEVASAAAAVNAAVQFARYGREGEALAATVHLPAGQGAHEAG